jgi:hypothetical protein
VRPINANWKSKPGSFDPLHALESFEATNDWNIPEVAAIDGPITVSWNLAYDDYRAAKRKGLASPSGDGLVHFFIDDYRFESTWASPDRALGYFGEHFVATPDFSLFRDQPRAIWLWNIYRSRWLGAYWQSKGARVLPTVSWALPSSFQFCFLGLPKRSVLLVSTVGIMSDTTAKELFVAGYHEMINQLDPVQVICYGSKLPPDLSRLADVTMLAPFYSKFKKEPL